MYRDWRTTKIFKEKERVKLQKSLPFNGQSSYQENYYPHEKRYYMERPTPFINSDNLKTSGKFINETTTKNSYMPIDYKRFVGLNKGMVLSSRSFSSLVSAPYSRDSFLSSYQRAFMHNNLTTKSARVSLDNDGNINSVLY